MVVVDWLFFLNFCRMERRFVALEENDLLN